MYLITVEGGDGSGKGEAVRILAELLEYYPFNEVHRTHEPRRHSDLGKLALESVKVGNKTPLQEAGLFAADRLIIRTRGLSHDWNKAMLLFPIATSTHPLSTKAWLENLVLTRYVRSTQHQ